MKMFGDMEEEFVENENSRLWTRIYELESAIRNHRDQTGHDQCWENDLELYETLGDNKDNLGPHKTLPCREEFMGRCKAYYESRLIELKVPGEK